MKQFVHLILLGLLFLTLMTGKAWGEASPFNVDVWSTADGLPQSSVIAMTQTHDGYLWLGTLNGLVRFDGNSFTRFNVNNTPGLPSDRIVFLFEDRRHNLWVGTDSAGMAVVHNGAVRNFPGSGVDGQVDGAVQDAAGNVWFSTRSGKFLCWTNGRLKSVQYDAPPQVAMHLFYRALHLRVNGKGNRGWMFRGNQIQELDSGGHVTDFGISPWPSALKAFAFRAGSGVYGAITYDANITAACEDSSGNLIVGTKDSGVYWLNAKGRWQHVSSDEGLSDPHVLSLCFDDEGNLWVGTDGGGLDRIRHKVFIAPHGLSSGVAQSVAEDESGGMWVAFNSRGLTYWRTNETRNYGIGTSSNAWTVLVDDHHRVWAGTRGEGLFQLSAGYFHPVMEAAPVGRQIYALFQSRDGKIWVGGDNGLGCFDGSTWKIYSSRDGLPPNAVRALAGNEKGILWIGTEGGGLYQLQAGRIIHLPSPVQDISCLLADRDGVLWVGTSGHGLARLKNGHWTICSTLNGGLASDSVNYLVNDQPGNLWIGSYEGLMRVEKKSFAEFASGAVKTVSCRTFLTRECSAGAQPAAIRARDGQLWFPTTHGVVTLNPAELKPNTNRPPVVIESVLVDGNRVNTNSLSPVAGGSITLTPDNEQLEIHFTSLDFSASKGARSGARFKYQLEGRDKNWTDVGTERAAHYTRLAPGHYVFHVIAANEDGYWNKAGATLAITVEPPFWRKSWFIAVSVLAFIGVLAGTIYLISTAKLKRQLRAHRQKEMLEKERARIARDLHDQLGANLTQVALLGELAEADKDEPDEVEQHAQQIYATARDTTRSLDEIVWALNSANDTLESLVNYVGKYAQDYFALAGVSYRSELPTHLPPTHILPEVRHNVFLAFKEAVNNVVKHAQATEARVKLQLEPGRFILSVVDNGRGLGDLSQKQLRNGLKNMRKRLADVHGEFEIMPGEKGGTVVRFIVPLPES